MTIKSALLGLTLVGAFAASPCDAALVTGSEGGPGGATFATIRDTATGLNWLSPRATTNRTISEVLAGYGGWVGAGYRYATGSELRTLLEHVGLAGSSAGVHAWTDAAAIQGMNALVTSLGWTYEDRQPSPGDALGKRTIYGVLADLYLGDGQSPASHQYVALVSSTDYAAIGAGGQWLYVGQDNLVGSFLVRDGNGVPEPGTGWLALFALGIAVAGERCGRLRRCQ